MNKKSEINLPQDWDEMEQHAAFSSSERIPVWDKRYSIYSSVAGKSFRNLMSEDKKTIEDGLVEGISRLDKNLIKNLFHERLAVQIELFLTEPYITRVDIDNVAKTIIDLLNNKTWKDDKQIYSLLISKRKSSRGGVVIKIGRLLTYRYRWG